MDDCISSQADEEEQLITAGARERRLSVALVARLVTPVLSLVVLLVGGLSAFKANAHGSPSSSSNRGVAHANEDRYEATLPLRIEVSADHPAPLITESALPPWFKKKGLAALKGLHCQFYSQCLFEQYRPTLEKKAAMPAPPQVNFDDFLAKDLNTCSCMKAGTCTTSSQTLVTGIVNIKKQGRSFHNYVFALTELLKHYPHTPWVVFVEKGYATRVFEEVAGGDQSQYLCVLEVVLEDFPEHSYINHWAEVMLKFFEERQTFKWPNGVSPEYDVVTNSKLALMARAATQNVFKSKSFAWLDGGFHAPQSYWIPIGDENVDILTCGDKLCVGYQYNIKCVSEEWWNITSRSPWLAQRDKGDGYMMGSVLTGSRQAVLNAANAHFAVLRRFMKDHVPDADQGTMLFLAATNPDVVENIDCNGYEWCPGYMLGAHNFENVSKYLHENCSEYADNGWHLCTPDWKQSCADEKHTQKKWLVKDDD